MNQLPTVVLVSSTIRDGVEAFGLPIVAVGSFTARVRMSLRATGQLRQQRRHRRFELRVVSSRP